MKTNGKDNSKSLNNINNIFEKYFNFINNFSVSNIDKKLIELPTIIGYYQNIYFSLKDKLQKYDMEIQRKWMEKYLYYKMTLILL